MKTLKYPLAMLAALAAGLAGAALAAEFPTKPITMLIGYQAGGGTDAALRAIAEPVAKDLGQPMLVQNKPGAGGGVAALSVAQSAPDGYTIVATTATTYSLEPQMQKVAYKKEDFQHVAIVGRFQEAIFSKSDAPYNTLKEMIAYAKAGDRTLKYASFYQLDKLVIGYIAKTEGVKIIPVPVKGGAGVMPAVLGGHVDFGWSGGSFGPHVESGAVKLLAAMTPGRLKAYPDVPSMNDFGYPGAGGIYVTLSVRAGTPRPIVDKLAAAFRKGMDDARYLDVLEKRNVLYFYAGPDEAGKLLDEQEAMFAKMVKSMNE